MDAIKTTSAFGSTSVKGERNHGGVQSKLHLAQFHFARKIEYEAHRRAIISFNIAKLGARGIVPNRVSLSLDTRPAKRTPQDNREAGQARWAEHRVHFTRRASSESKKTRQVVEAIKTTNPFRPTSIQRERNHGGV